MYVNMALNVHRNRKGLMRDGGTHVRIWLAYILQEIMSVVPSVLKVVRLQPKCRSSCSAMSKMSVRRRVLCESRSLIMQEENWSEVEHSLLFRLAVASTRLSGTWYSTMVSRSVSESRRSPEHSTSVMWL